MRAAGRGRTWGNEWGVIRSHLSPRSSRMQLRGLLGRSDTQEGLCRDGACPSYLHLEHTPHHIKHGAPRDSLQPSSDPNLCPQRAQQLPSNQSVCWGHLHSEWRDEGVSVLNLCLFSRAHFSQPTIGSRVRIRGPLNGGSLLPLPPCPPASPDLEHGVAWK